MTTTTHTTPSRDSSPADFGTVLVLGGTGKTGRRVVAELRSRGFTTVAASRTGEVRFDWADRSTWEPGLTGVRSVYVVDSQGPGMGEEVRDFAALAARLGVERLVLLSARSWPEIDATNPHLAPEREVRESGLRWTILRPTWFAENFTELEFFAPLLETGELRLPTGSGREPFVVLQDLVDVAVAALTEDGHAGRTYTLSGARSLNFADAVAEIAGASGRTLRFTPVSEEEYRADVAAAGYPEEVADLLVTILHHIRDEGGASVTDGVRQALGREPRDFSEYVRTTDFSAVGATEASVATA
ncbi:NAD(P)H-binding protein [Streptomyces sp. NPDC047315]|uniref:NAD(P)H-binding protein n=1 Tax=Streptomyces sp. NPDC047315 TaxID=3155142 RepID=UPI0033C785B6